MALKRDAGRPGPTSAEHKGKNYTRNSNTWRAVQRQHEHRAADFARRFAHRRGGP